MFSISPPPFPLEGESFDLVIGLEKEPRGAALVSRVKAEVKREVSGSARKETSVLLNRASEYAFYLGLSDELKFYQNRKTYPELIFEIAEIEYEGEEYLLFPGPEETAFAREVRPEGPPEKRGRVIGLNTGAGRGICQQSLDGKRIPGAHQEV